MSFFSLLMYKPAIVGTEDTIVPLVVFTPVEKLTTRPEFPPFGAVSKTDIK